MPPACRLVRTAILLLALGSVTAAAAAAPRLAVKFVSVRPVVTLGSGARVEVATVPGAICDIEVRSPAGLVRTAGIRPKKALDSGRIVWTWRVGKTMRPGIWKVAVDCLLGEHLGRAQTAFTVKPLQANR